LVATSDTAIVPAREAFLLDALASSARVHRWFKAKTTGHHLFQTARAEAYEAFHFSPPEGSGGRARRGREHLGRQL
jgi:hypothetical protein